MSQGLCVCISTGKLNCDQVLTPFAYTSFPSSEAASERCILLLLCSCHSSLSTCDCPAPGSAALLSLCLQSPHLRHGPAPAGPGDNGEPCPGEKESCGMAQHTPPRLWGHHEENSLIRQSPKVRTGVQISAAPRFQVLHPYSQEQLRCIL